MKGINHEEGYSLDGAYTNWAEESFSRMRAEIGHHPHIVGAYLLRYTQKRHGAKTFVVRRMAIR